MKQTITLVPATVERKVGIFKKETIEGYKVTKSTNYPADNFYTKKELDELTDMGITYDIKYGD
jgi:hypothetical protein